MVMMMMYSSCFAPLLLASQSLAWMVPHSNNFLLPAPSRVAAVHRKPLSSSSALSATQAAGFGVSDASSTVAAVGLAVESAKKELGRSGSEMEPSIAFVSSTVSRDPEEVRQAFVDNLPPACRIHGITSSGAILTSEGAKAGAVGCLLLSSSSAEKDFATAFDAQGDGRAAAVALQEQMPSPQAIFMGATPGAEEGVIDALAEVFPDVPVFGGTAADDELSGAWAVMSADASSGAGVSLVGIGESVPFGASMLGPYTPTEKTAKATKTDGRRVFEIDGKPAADWVYEWLGDDVKEQYENGGLILPQTALSPIGIKQGGGGLGDEYVTCHLAALGGEEKYVDFFTPIPEGSTLIVMDSGDGPATGYASALATAFDTAKAQGSLSEGDTAPKAGILVFCGGMAIAVGDNLDKGLTSDEFSSKVNGLPLMGMTCFGEQGSLPESKANVQRNLSTGLVLFG